MTIIYSNFGDRDTGLLQAMWQGLHADRLIVICHDDENYEDAVEEALIAEDDTLIICGHGTSYGLLHPNLESGQYIIHENNVHLIHAQNVIGVWCWASAFAQTHHLHGFFTGMFISNLEEAHQYLNTQCINDIMLDHEICEYEIYFMNHINDLLQHNIPLQDWEGTFSSINRVGQFNTNSLYYYDVQQTN